MKRAGSGHCPAASNISPRTWSIRVDPRGGVLTRRLAITPAASAVATTTCAPSVSYRNTIFGFDSRCLHHSLFVRVVSAAWSGGRLRPSRSPTGTTPAASKFFLFNTLAARSLRRLPLKRIRSRTALPRLTAGLMTDVASCITLTRNANAPTTENRRLGGSRVLSTKHQHEARSSST